MVLQVFNLPSLLFYFNIELAVAYVHSPFSMLSTGVSWYVAFATALLPMAIMIERRRIARAWQLTHRKLSTAVGVVAVLALSMTVERLLDRLPSGLVETLGSTVISIPLSVPTTVAYYTIYPAHTEAVSADDSTQLSYEDHATQTGT